MLSYALYAVLCYGAFDLRTLAYAFIRSVSHGRRAGNSVSWRLLTARACHHRLLHFVVCTFATMTFYTVVGLTLPHMHGCPLCDFLSEPGAFGVHVALLQH